MSTRTRRFGSAGPFCEDVVCQDVVIADACTADLDPILELEESAFPPRQQWSRLSWAGELAGNAMHALTARHRNEDAPTGLLGALAIRLLGDQADLDRLMVAPPARRSGIGQKLLSAGLDLAQRSGTREMILEVAQDNPAAIALYDTAGFHTLATRPAYYGPGIDAMIMKRNLS